MALAQSTPAASRLGDLQVGGSFTNANSDYGIRINGFGFYSDFDFRRHIGAEVDFHQLNDYHHAANARIYERSYEAGGRYFWNFGRFKPYGKGLYGRGVFNFPLEDASVPRANLAFNTLNMGAGVDIAVLKHLNVRAEYEYQHWFGFQQNSLTPQLITVGVAYHFPPGKPRRR